MSKDSPTKTAEDILSVSDDQDAREVWQDCRVSDLKALARAYLDSQNSSIGPQLFTDKEALSYLRMSKVTLWKERKAGNIGFRKLGAKVVYTREDLDEYLERNRQGATAK